MILAEKGKYVVVQPKVEPMDFNIEMPEIDVPKVELGEWNLDVPKFNNIPLYDNEKDYQIQQVADGGFMDSVRGFGDFLSKWHETGSFWEAMYGKPFLEVVGDFLLDLLKEIAKFILGNSDVFLLLPAIILLFGTFMIGRHKFTKWIVPLFFGYFVSKVFYGLLLQ